MSSFKLTALPEDVQAVEAVFAIAEDEGYVLCRIHEGREWVVWLYQRDRDAVYEDEDSGRVTLLWGHYFSDRDEALRDLFIRTGFGIPEALTI